MDTGIDLAALAGPDAILDPTGASASPVPIAGITADSRHVEPGFIFAALSGTRTHGSRFSRDAVKRGAVAILAKSGDKVEGEGVPVLRSANPHQALARMAARFYPRQPEVMVGVTGTAGKTSVTVFLRQIWEHEGRKAASIGTIGVVGPKGHDVANLTTPDPVALHRQLDGLARSGVTHGGIEASSHGLDQYRLDGVRLGAAGFTNLGRDHLDYHPDMESYLAAKMRLFTEILPEGAPAVVFADDGASAKVAEDTAAAGREVRLVGRKGDFLTVKRIEHERFRQVAEIRYEDVDHRVEFPLAGDFQIANALVAAGLALSTGSAAKPVFEALEDLKGAPGRLEIAGRTEEGSPVYVDYAHKPEALENVLKAVRPFTTGKLVLVFGCGGDRDPGKRPIMGQIAQALADKVIVTDDNPRSEQAGAIRAQILSACPDAEEIPDRREAIGTAVQLLRSGDVLIVAGKGHEEGQIVGDTVLPFSDRDVVAASLAQRHGEGAGS